MLDDSKIAEGFVNGLKWLVNTGMALLAASGSVIAILQYINQPDTPSTPAPVFITPMVITNTPWSGPTATQTDLPPMITNTPMPVAPSSVDFVYSYWQNVSDGRYENAWAQLSPGFNKPGTTMTTPIICSVIRK